MLKAKSVSEITENSTAWAVISGSAQETVPTQNLEQHCPVLVFHSGMLKCSKAQGGFVALSIFDLGNLKNTCLEAEPEVMILACPYH